MTKNSLDRRELLKLTGAALGGALLPHMWSRAPRSTQAEGDNILVLVFDTLSAENMDLYGSARPTMPNLTRFADQCYVYRQHYAGGPYTTPGTASLLTGTYPWTHRALNFGGQAAPEVAGNNMFAVFDDRYRVAYTHNRLASNLLDQFHQAIDEYIPMQDLLLWQGGVANTLFRQDWPAFIRSMERIKSNLLFGGEWFQEFKAQWGQAEAAVYADDFPTGPPLTQGVPFRLEDAFDYMLDNLGAYASPYLAYFHFYPPHFPYKPRAEFINAFQDDGWQPLRKEAHMLRAEREVLQASYPTLVAQHRVYDEYLLYIDAEFGRWMDRLEAMGALADTWLIVTSDHGELFERGVWGHTSPLLHEGVMHIPLLIRPPGGTIRQNIHSPTSAVDVLPTLLTLAGKDIPTWVEGLPLPPWGQAEANRSIFALQSVDTVMGGQIEIASWMVRTGDHKLTSYYGYEDLVDERPFHELYDLSADPDELDNLFYRNNQDPIVAGLYEKLRRVIQAANSR